MVDQDSELPTGTVTFLFTDLEGSTHLWEKHPVEMVDALSRHDALLRGAIEDAGGFVVKTTGDGAHAVFPTAGAALVAATSAQLALTREPWDTTGPLRVRMGLHTGVADYRDRDYFGPTLNRAARIMAAAHGGQVLCSQATAELVLDDLDPAVRLEDLGHHRLRDLGRSEHVYQVAHQALPDAFPVIRSLESYPSNLPTYLTNFVGRESELETISGQVTQSRLVTLTGTGGVGKTRLAVHVAARVLPAFRDGAWLCELATADDVDALEQVVATSLGVQQRRTSTVREAVVDALRGRSLLLVLDNCEHLLNPVADFVDLVLASCPELHVLATSRELLGVPGERAVGVRSLAIPSSESATSAAQTAAVQLFVDRASAVRERFVLDDTNAGSVAEICRRLDGIPLAIELAAARVRAMSAAAIAERLDERFRLLTGGRRSGVERHQTLRSAVDWSYSLLDDTGKRVFERLGAFAGSFDLAAAEGVLADDTVEAWSVIDALTDLVDKSMVVADTIDEVMRYQLLETMRQYAREHLEAAGTADHWRKRHAEYYAGLSEQVSPSLVGPDEVAARRRLGTEVDNLRAAVTWAQNAADPESRTLGYQIVAALAWLSGMDPSIAIGTWARRAVSEGDAVPSGLRGVVLATAAWWCYETNKVEEGRTLANEAAAIHDLPIVGITLAAAASAALVSNEGRMTDAFAVLDGAKEMLTCGSTAERLWATATLDSMAAIFASLGNDEERARRAADSADQAARALGSPAVLALALFARGFVLRDRDPERALPALEECVELIREGAANAVLGNALLAVAQIRAQLGDRAAALAALREALQDAIDRGDAMRSTPIVMESFLLLADSSPEAAAVLFGAVHDGELAYIQAMLVEADQERQRQAIHALEALDPSQLEAARRRGASMTQVDLAELALTELSELP